MSKKLKVVFIMFLFSLIITGCENKEISSNNDGSMTSDFKKMCIDGVVYLDGYRSLALWIDEKTLKPARCRIEYGIIKVIN